MAQTLVLGSNRTTAHRLIDAAPQGSVCTIKAPARSTEQNSRLWAMLSEISRAKPEGRELPPEVWKSLFMSEAGFKPIFEPALDGKGVVPIGYKSSRLTKAEFGDLFLAIEEYAARHGIQLGDEQ